MPMLEVHQLYRSEVYRDIIRVNKVHRLDRDKKLIREGQVCFVRANGRACFAVLRGYEDCDAPQIRMDDYTRGEHKLNLKRGEKYQFEFSEVGFLGKLRWAWNASEMGYQVASRLAVFSLGLGAAALVISLDWHWVLRVLRLVFSKL